jgi:transcriptional regulator with XRE-family HTH domain
MGHGYVGELERGDRSPSLATILRLAEALDTTASALLEGMCWSGSEATTVRLPLRDGPAS